MIKNYLWTHSLWKEFLPAFVYWPLLSLKAQLTVTFLVVVSVLPDGLISSDTFASNTSYFHTDCIWTVMFIFYRGKHVFFFHKSQFPSELLFLLYQAQASKPSAWMVLFFYSVAILEFCFSLIFQVFFSFSSNFVTWYICWHPGYMHAFLYTF